MVQVGPRPGADETVALAPAPPALEPEQHAPPQPRRRYTVELPFDPELLPYLGLVLLGLVLRLYDLGAKALHHDESLHAFYAWRLYVGEGYVHDPMMHGPLLFEGNALAYLLFGDSDFTARLVPALLGTALIGLPFFLRAELGRWGAVAASALLVIAPAFLYFSRFIRHDIYVDVFTLLLVIGVFRYLAGGRRAWFYTAVVAAALLFATKEDFYISGFIPFTFLVGCWFLLRGQPRALFRARVRALGWEAWAVGLVVFLAINLLLYTTFLTNMRGICTAVVTLPLQGCAGAQGALNYWFAQQDYARGGQPWFYYLMLLPLYEFVPLVLAVLALFLVRGRDLFFWFCVYWAVAAVGIYSWAGEKMPWMLPQMTLPLVLLAGRLLGQWAEAGWGRRALSARGLATAGLVLLALFAFLAWLGLGAAPAGSALEQQSATLQRLALSALIAAIAGTLMYLGPRWGGRVVVPGIALGLLGIAGAAYLRTALMVTYDHPDTPSEPLIYVQSSPDVVFIAHEIERISQQTGQGKTMPILLDNGWGDADHEAVSWPFEWYLRNYKNRRYFTKTIDPSINLADYPVMLVRSTNLDPIASDLAQYTGQQYKLNWWFPEDYKQYAGGGPTLALGGLKVELPWLRFDLIKNTLAVPDNRTALLKFLLYRQAPGEMGAREMYFYVNKSVPALGPAPTGGGAAAAPPANPAAAAAPALRPAVAQPRPDGSVVYGRAADGSAVLADPKNAAYGPDGRLYVVDGRGNRVVVFNPDGSIAGSWGSPGQGDGQFQEPWGIAVAPNGSVYVADTWNHRIQYFDPSGTFLGKWGKLGDAKGSTEGEPGVFWGPRAIAIGPDGELYVTDTGNKRVQVFGLDGTFRRMFGGAGSQPGQFNEPVGLALDRAGHVWVADAWNHRIQELDGQGKPLAQFPSPAGWESQSVTNKPYLAVDGQGRVIVTQPDAGQVSVLGADGSLVKSIQLAAPSSAVGVTLAPDGRIVVADARGSDVIAEPAP
jgi:uncharacterized protein (TIGR03663 family)